MSHVICLRLGPSTQPAVKDPTLVIFDVTQHPDLPATKTKIKTLEKKVNDLFVGFLASQNPDAPAEPASHITLELHPLSDDQPLVICGQEIDDSVRRSAHEAAIVTKAAEQMVDRRRQQMEAQRVRSMENQRYNDALLKLVDERAACRGAEEAGEINAKVKAIQEEVCEWRKAVIAEQDDNENARHKHLLAMAKTLTAVETPELGGAGCKYLSLPDDVRENTHYAVHIELIDDNPGDVAIYIMGHYTGGDICRSFREDMRRRNRCGEYIGRHIVLQEAGLAFGVFEKIMRPTERVNVAEDLPSLACSRY